MKQKKGWYVWFAVSAVLIVLFDAYAFAGLQLTPQVGAAVAAQARLEAPLMHTYLVAGRQILGLTPFMQDFATHLSAWIWGEAFEPIRQRPDIAVYLLQHRSQGVMHALFMLLYWAPVLLVPLAVIGWIRRPRKISLIGGKK